MVKKIRFAPLIRVSTEKQERQGESLNTQRKQIIGYVESLGGTIPKRCWKYSGQEHATVDSERKNLDQLLEDTTKNIFDAIIVCDVSRWSRDNAKSKQGLQILRDNGIKFYVGTTEFDLFDPQASLFLGMSTEMNEFFALEQSRKSMLNRIERALAGKQSVGRPPYGRIYNKKTLEWSIDKGKKDRIVTAAKRYLNGEGLDRIADSMGFVKSHLRKTLNEKCGDKWPVNFNSKRLNMKQTIEIPIPRLLPEKMIKRIHEKAKANKTYLHAQSKHKYLLSRMILCVECGRGLTGCIPNDKLMYRYYKHYDKRFPCKHFKRYIRAGQIETDVLTHIYSMIGDKVGLKKAIDAAIPNKKEIEQSQDRLSQITFDLKRIDNEIQRLVKAVMKATLDDDTVKKQMAKLKERESLLNDEEESLKAIIKNQPSEAEINQRSLGWKMMLNAKYTKTSNHLLEMSFEERRQLLQALFDGVDENGKRLGVYIKKLNNKKHPWYYEIRGNLPSLTGTGVVGVPPISFDTTEELDQFKSIRKELLEQKPSSLH